MSKRKILQPVAHGNVTPDEARTAVVAVKESRDMTNNVVDLGKEKKFPVEQELYDRIVNLIYDEYGGELSLVSILGILELAKKEILDRQIIELDD